MRIGAFMVHTFAAGFVDRGVFFGQVGNRIGGIVNVLPGLPVPPIP